MSSSTTCPICQNHVPGDSVQFQRHVNDHLDETEQDESRKVAEKMHNQNLSDLNHSTNGAHQSAQIENDQLGPAEQMMKDLQVSDEAYARSLALSGGHALDNPETLVPTLRGSLSDTAEHFYPNILAKIFPYHEALEGMAKKKTHITSKLDLFCSNVAGVGWDCGFRNIQIMFSTLFHYPDSARQLKEAGLSEVPSVPEIAGLIEEAWKKGFDPEGAATFDGKLMDKEVWIGATEVYVLLRSLDLEAYVKDFEAPTAVDKQRMFEWIFDHFGQWCNGRHCMIHCKSLLGSRRQCLVPPIFCQWQGHSITIVGAEKGRGGDVVLLVLDPSRGFYQSLMQQRVSRLHLVRRAIDHTQFAHPRFQLVSLPAPRSSGMPSIRQAKRKVLDRLRGGPS